MASKQLGKLRQWGREVISTKERAVLTDQFKELEQDVDLRKTGIERLHSACTEYHAYLHKKKEYPTVEEGVKMLPVDAMGAVMMTHGEEFGDNSAFGQCLLKLGRAHCKIATIQESYALTLRDTYLANLESTLDELKDYTTQRKKLDSRRLAYDAARTRSAKAKKEKEVKEAEEELSKAKLRYEEISTDVQERMHAIREKEIKQLRDLTEFLATEIRFVEQYLEVLRDTRDEWFDESVILPSDVPHRKASPHAFASGRSTPSISSTSKTSTSFWPSSISTGDAMTADASGDDDDHGFSAKRRAPHSNTTRPSSRGSVTSTGTAHTSRRRSDSGGISDGGGAMSKRMSVAGWASNAMSSLGRSKDVKKDKTAAKQRDKEARRAFASLENDRSDSSEDTDPIDIKEAKLSSSFVMSSRTAPTSLPQLRNALESSSVSSSNSHPGSASMLPKVGRASHGFTGSVDELSFRAGNEILVVSDAKSDLSVGELSGKRGLFPANHTEDIVSRMPPPVPPRMMTDIAKRAQNDPLSEDDMSIMSTDGPQVGLYDAPFGDHHVAKSPLPVEQYPEAATDDDEDEMQSLFAERPISSMPQTMPAYSPEGLEIGNIAGNAARAIPPPPPLPQRKQAERKPPPPPPARRSTTGGITAPIHTSDSGRPFVSVSPSTSDLSGASFPAAPSTSRRSTSHAGSSNAPGSSVPARVSTSPFEH